MNKEKEKELIDLCRGGNAEAFGLLYDAYAREIYRFVYYKTSHKETAEDLVGQVFTKAWSSITGYRGIGFRAWLYGIARNAVIDHYRRKRPTEDIDDHWDLASPDNQAGELDKQFDQARIRAALSTLSFEERDILIMRFWQDMEYREIAVALGKTEGAVKMKAYRTLANMKDRFAITPLAFIFLKYLL